MDNEYGPVIDFWFRELTPQQWFADGGPALDMVGLPMFGITAITASKG
jgi:hypothetical protein